MDETGSPTDRLRIRRLRSEELTAADVGAIRALMAASFGDDPEEAFTDDDWEHAVGGIHLVADVDGEIVGHASVVPRLLRIGDREIRTGYVEAVATTPARQGQGIGTQLMRLAADHIGQRYELGALGTGSHAFYARLGWRTWRGRSSVRTPDGPRPTTEDDGSIMVLPTPSSPALDFDAPISCEWRAGDVW